MSIKDLFKKENKNLSTSTGATSHQTDKVGKSDKSVTKTDQTDKSYDIDKKVKKDDSKKDKTTLGIVDKKQIKDLKSNKATDISYRVLLKPLVTEKGSAQAILGKYLFMVATDANKIMIAKAVERTYGVKVSSVNIMNYSGKKVSRGRVSGKRKDWKKAIVTLKKGQTIEVFKGV